MGVKSSTTSWSPSRLPKLRDQTARQLADPGSFMHSAMIGTAPGSGLIPSQPRSAPGPYGSPPRNPSEDTAGLRRLATHLGASELFWVTPLMSALAIGSAASLDEVRWTNADRPAPFGLVIWDQGIGSVTFGGLELPVIAASWAPHADGLAYCIYMSRYQVAEWVLASAGIVAPVDDMPPLVPMWSAVLPVGPHWSPAEDLGVWRTPLTTMAATWALMQQPTIADRTRVEVDKPIRASYRRADRPDPEVTLIDLRRRYVPDGQRDDDYQPGRLYRHRWIVQGHWRDQPHGPGRAERRKTWIASYIKGPDDLPLLETTRVNVWRR